MIKKIVLSKIGYLLIFSLCAIISKIYKPIQKWQYLLRYEKMMYPYRSLGISWGEGTIFYNVDFSRSFKGDNFSIGKNCVLTECVLLGHDASPAMFIKELQLKPVYMPGSRLSYRKEIIIGDNVFIGYGVIVLPGVKIGNNVVVAAGSVVTKNLPGNYVYAGNPARPIKPIDEYTSKYLEEFKKNPRFF